MNEVLKKRKNLFREMLAISNRQVEFCRGEELESGDLSGLMELINRRQMLMDEIDRLHSSLMSERTTDDEGRDSPYHPAQDEELVTVMEAIRRNDETCLQLLHENAGQLSMRIKQTRNHRRASEAYQGNSVNDAWFVDKKR